MVDPLYRALVLTALGLAGCGDNHTLDAGADAGEQDASEEQDASAADASTDAVGEEDAPCPADAELSTSPCYFIL